MISIIAAIGKNRELGKDNGLLWHIPGELPRFKKITTGHPIIMGRKTFESIGRVLPNRTNIIITRDKAFDPRKFCHGKKCDVFMVNSLQEAIEEALEASSKYYVSGIKYENNKGIHDTKYTIPATDENEIFIIGGGQIFEQAMPLADKLYLTLVDASFDADTFFPDYSMFTKVIEKEDQESEEFKYTFLTLER